MRVEDDAASLDIVNTSCFENTGIDAIEAFYLFGFALDECGEADGGFGLLPAETDGVVEVLGEFRGVNEEFLWDAASDDACAACSTCELTGDETKGEFYYCYLLGGVSRCVVWGRRT